MSHCHGSASPGNKKSRRLWPWLLGGFTIVVAVSWAFQGNPLVDQLAPLALGGLALVWLVAWTVRRMEASR